MELTTIYRRVLNQIAVIYKDSQYNSDVDLYRIKDIMDSVNDDRLQQMQWCVDTLAQHVKQPERVLVMGDLYGVFMALLDQHWQDAEVEAVEFDDQNRDIGEQMFPQFRFITDDVLINFTHKRENIDLLIITNGETIEKNDLSYLIRIKNDDAIACIQSTTPTDLDTDINCYPTLQEFEDSLSLKKVLWAGQYNIDGSSRLMVIGR